MTMRALSALVGLTILTAACRGNVSVSLHGNGAGGSGGSGGSSPFATTSSVTTPAPTTLLYGTTSTAVTDSTTDYVGPPGRLDATMSHGE